MPATTVNLSPNTTYALIVLANAANYQKATVTPSGGQPKLFTKNTPGLVPNELLSSPREQIFRTDGTGNVTVDVQNSADNIHWNSSKLQPAPITLEGVSNAWGRVVGSEDGTDNDYNDCIVMFYPADQR
jgi:hypothetical protein